MVQEGDEEPPKVRTRAGARWCSRRWCGLMGTKRRSLQRTTQTAAP